MVSVTIETKYPWTIGCKIKFRWLTLNTYCQLRKDEEK